LVVMDVLVLCFFSSRRRHTRFSRDWSSDVCSSDLAAVLGVPAYIYAAFSFFVQGVPFGLIGGGAPGQILTLLVVLVLELTAYFFVVSGGGMLLATIWRGGFGRLPDGFRKLLSTLPVAMLLLLVGAWFEATALILGF